MRELLESSLRCGFMIRVITPHGRKTKSFLLSLSNQTPFLKDVETISLDRQHNISLRFNEAVRLFLRSPQTKLVRHICLGLASDPGYLVNNQRNIEQTVHSILAVQGVDPEVALRGFSVFELIRVAGKKLNIKIEENRWMTLSP